MKYIFLIIFNSTFSKVEILTLTPKHVATIDVIKLVLPPSPPRAGRLDFALGG